MILSIGRAVGLAVGDAADPADEPPVSWRCAFRALTASGNPGSAALPPEPAPLPEQAESEIAIRHGKISAVK